MSELKQHGGKIALANKILIPGIAARKFPAVDVIYSDGRKSKLPIVFDASGIDASKLAVPEASLVCLSFRANSQAMVDSWSKPFYDTFSESKSVQLYEVLNFCYLTFHSFLACVVSFIDSWLLCLNPIKRLLLLFMRKSSDGAKDALQRHIVYSFGDHYYFRKELKILNLLTGYIFLLDKFGRIRWQGFGLAKQEELSSLIYCTKVLLEEK
ncbi:Mitochondria isoform 1 [Gossypium australe]|uniref:Mitochondria isoform 1 n=1 Tax=Gossypium australe TaxID=47621 RepID=A0A5B6UNQ6_9ROSI|nr:Mitochondria isoform 1 [Gossypium australe]